MSFEVGEILEGKVTGITKFGAFVAMDGGKSGLVHISEVANAFVSDINEFLSVGQQVKVKIVSISPDGKISLSIKKAAAGETAQAAPAKQEDKPRRPRPAQQSAPAANAGEYYQPQRSNDQSFEEKLKQFMQDSGSKMSGSRLYEQPRKSRRR